MDKYECAAQELNIPNIKKYLKNMKSDLETRANKWMTSFETTEGASLALQDTPKIEADVKESGKPFVSLRCVLCRKSIRIGFEQGRGRNSSRAVFKRGNFDKHMMIHHKEYINTNMKIEKI